MIFFFFQAEDGIRDLVRSRGLGDVYKRQNEESVGPFISGGALNAVAPVLLGLIEGRIGAANAVSYTHLTLPTSDLV